MKNYVKLELQIKTSQGLTKCFTCDMATEWVLKGGKRIPVACPILVNYEVSNVELDVFVGYRGTFEIIQYIFLEGPFAFGEIENNEDVVLAKWDFLLDGKIVDINELQFFPKYSVA